MNLIGINQCGRKASRKSTTVAYKSKKGKHGLSDIKTIVSYLHMAMAMVCNHNGIAWVPDSTSTTIPALGLIMYPQDNSLKAFRSIINPNALISPSSHLSHSSYKRHNHFALKHATRLAVFDLLPLPQAFQILSIF